MVNIVERNKKEHDSQHAHRKRKEADKTFDTESYFKLVTETRNLVKNLENKFDLELKNRISDDDIEVIFNNVEDLRDKSILADSMIYNLACFNLKLLGCVYHDQYSLEKLDSLCHIPCDV